MKNKFMLIFGLVLTVAVGAVCAGCTPESPPLEPLQSSEEVSQLPEKTTLAEESQISAAISEPVESHQQNNDKTESVEQFSEIVLWDDNKSLPTSINFSQILDSGIINYKCDDNNILKSLVNALRNIKVLEKTDERYEYDCDELTINFEDRSEQVIYFEHGGLLKNNLRYNINGYEELKEILNVIKEYSTKAGSETTFDEWVVNMSKVDKKISILCGSEEYINGNMDKKKELAMKTLEGLENEGLIESGSILYANDSISYQYKGGGIGAIMLKEFDPMMN